MMKLCEILLGFGLPLIAVILAVSSMLLNVNGDEWEDCILSDQYPKCMPANNITTTITPEPQIQREVQPVEQAEQKTLIMNLIPILLIVLIAGAVLVVLLVFTRV